MGRRLLVESVDDGEEGEEGGQRAEARGISQLITGSLGLGTASPGRAAIRLVLGALEPLEL
jgi:hypothetical protein